MRDYKKKDSRFLSKCDIYYEIFLSHFRNFMNIFLGYILYVIDYFLIHFISKNRPKYLMPKLTIFDGNVFFHQTLKSQFSIRFFYFTFFISYFKISFSLRLSILILYDVLKVG